MSGLICPKCGGELAKDSRGKVLCFRCQRGHGVCMTVSGLRSFCGSGGFATTLWQKALLTKTTGKNPCPVCRRKMKQVVLPLADKYLELDVCCQCQEIWFDPDELESVPLPAAPPPKTPEEVEADRRMREAIALYEVERLEEAADNSSDHSPDYSWKLLPALFGFPVEQNTLEIERPPFVTWGITALCVLIYLLTANNLHDVVQNWGLIPNQLWRHGGATFISSMFLHAGFWHLAGNMYFLLIFGDNVEDMVGKWRYILLILVSGISAAAIFAAFNRGDDVPMVGASGFISGVIAAYAVLLPKVRLSFLLFHYWIVVRWLALPAWGAFGLWILYQIAMAMLAGNAGGIAYIAHVGGAVPGMIFALILRFVLERNVEKFNEELSLLDEENGER